LIGGNSITFVPIAHSRAATQSMIEWRCNGRPNMSAVTPKAFVVHFPLWSSDHRQPITIRLHEHICGGATSPVTTPLMFESRHRKLELPRPLVARCEGVADRRGWGGPTESIWGKGSTDRLIPLDQSKNREIGGQNADWTDLFAFIRTNSRRPTPGLRPRT